MSTIVTAPLTWSEAYDLVTELSDLSVDAAWAAKRALADVDIVDSEGRIAALAADADYARAAGARRDAQDRLISLLAGGEQ